ncbi:hypothetical protein [Vibrio alginolyticus]|uniref:hypothetical protein n=1 Tax=Vibrio TaxID=662 RepID=UPI0006CAA81A|nr:hypothetical protein [Vibrio alginolyticus]KPM97581.1 hypothetical protein AOG25_14015 [Vibrio alginolyticus]CAH7200095.1 conserved hypothetical protein [Vibrio chagasii]CAH7367428.1 conserved hypothetical protein [Vibrio chagasii]
MYIVDKAEKTIDSLSKSILEHHNTDPENLTSVEFVVNGEIIKTLNIGEYNSVPEIGTVSLEQSISFVSRIAVISEVFNKELASNPDMDQDDLYEILGVYNRPLQGAAHTIAKDAVVHGGTIILVLGSGIFKTQFQSELILERWEQASAFLINGNACSDFRICPVDEIGGLTQFYTYGKQGRNGEWDLDEDDLENATVENDDTAVIDYHGSRLEITALYKPSDFTMKFYD